MALWSRYTKQVLPSSSKPLLRCPTPITSNHLCSPITAGPAFSPLYATPPKAYEAPPQLALSRLPPKPSGAGPVPRASEALLRQSRTGRPRPIRFPTPPETPPQQAHTLPTGPESPPLSPQQRPLPGPAWFPAPRGPAPSMSRSSETCCLIACPPRASSAAGSC